MKKLLLPFLFCFISCKLFCQDTAQADTSKKKYDLVKIEEQPRYPGGDEALFKFIQSNLQYPRAEFDQKIQGRVYVRFIIDKDGSVTDVELDKGINGGEGLNKEAIRIVKLMPKWIPGKQNGIPVKVRFIIPVIFKIH